jgi:DNA-binding transcriptional regulator YiaG
MTTSHERLAMKQKTLGHAEPSESATAPLEDESRCGFDVELPLHKLRQSKALSQVTLAKTMHTNQAAISKIEHRNDICVSTLREYIRALGGQLEIVARFPDGAIKISNFTAQPGLQNVQAAATDAAPSYGVALG